MKKLSLILLCSFMIACSAFAGGSIFGQHKKTRNTDGVSSIGIKICRKLPCTDAIYKEGNCGNIEHATQLYGVCVCDDGYRTENGQCVADPSSAIVSALTEEEQILLGEAKQIQGKSSDINTLTEKLAKVTQTRQKFESEKTDEEQKRVNVFKNTEEQLTALIDVMEKWHQDASEIANLRENLTAENIDKLRSLLQKYKAEDYPEKVLNILGLGGFVTTAQNTYSEKASEIIHGLFGIKTAYAGGIAGACAEYATGAFVWDMAVGVAGTLGDLTCWVCDVEARPSDYTKYLNVAVLVDSVVDSIPYLDTVNHCHEILLDELMGMFTNESNEISAACPVCPDGGALGTDNETCCKNGYSYVKESGYTGVSDVCREECPDGGVRLEPGTVCCKDKYGWNDTTKKYDVINNGACGCAVGEKVMVPNIGPFCCDGLNEVADNGDRYPSMYCGCPDEGVQVVPKEGQSSLIIACCKDGYMLDEFDMTSYRYSAESARVCGCPDEGVNSDRNSGICCKDGHSYVAGSGYTGLSESCAQVCSADSVICDTETGECTELGQSEE